MVDDPLEHSRETRHLLNSHIQLTQLKLDQLNTTMEAKHNSQSAKLDQMYSALKWAGGLIISLILTVLGWSLIQQINANEAAKKDMQQQIDLLKAQEAERLRYRDEIISLLSPRTTETPDAPVGSREK